MDLNYNCPACGTRSELIIGPTQAFCTNTDGCSVLTFNPSLPDGGMSDARFIKINEERQDEKPKGT